MYYQPPLYYDLAKKPAGSLVEAVRSSFFCQDRQDWPLGVRRGLKVQRLVIGDLPRKWDDVPQVGLLCSIHLLGS